MSYYARNDEEREFDNTIRDSIKTSKTKSHMALYLQGQEQLSLLREIVDNQKACEDDIHAVYDLIRKQEELKEIHDVEYSENDGYLTLKKEVIKLRRKIDDLMEYICESQENTRFSWEGVENKLEKQLREDAIAMVKLHALRNKSLLDGKGRGMIMGSSEKFETQIKKNGLIWDYILCCLMDE